MYIAVSRRWLKICVPSGWGLSIALLALLIIGSAGVQAPALDTAGKIYVADTGNHRIVRIDDMTGAGWTTVGNQGSGANQFNSPNGIFVDTPGKIHVTDTLNDRIVRVNDMTGAGWTTFGSQGSGTNQFKFPASIFADAIGKIYVADTFNDRIVSISCCCIIANVPGVETE